MTPDCTDAHEKRTTRRWLWLATTGWAFSAVALYITGQPVDGAQCLGLCALFGLAASEWPS